MFTIWPRCIYQKFPNNLKIRNGGVLKFGTFIFLLYLHRKNETLFKKKLR
jgi:hypothetical protein